MFNKLSLFVLLVFSTTVYANEYMHASNPGIIHITTITSSECGNLLVSTKVGYSLDSGKCLYVKETEPQGFDWCEVRQLHGAMLETKVGAGFNCAATHVRSMGTGHEGLDEYQLISNREGHYTGTVYDFGNIDLK